MKRKGLQPWIHILCCLVFLSLPFFFSPDGPNNPAAFFSNAGSYRELARYSLLIIYFYLNYYILIPRFHFGKKYIAFASVTIFCFFVTMLVPNLLVHFNPAPYNSPGMQMNPPPRPMNDDRPFPSGQPEPPSRRQDFPERRFPDRKQPSRVFDNVRQHIFLFLAAFFFSLLLRIRERLRRTEEEKVEKELSYLKAQINPHFLFNTLNSIYALAITQSDETASAVVKLSGMMRYVLYETSHDFVALEKEMNYIKDYVDFQELRFGDNVPIKFTIVGHLSNLQIAPLILITFVENAFKYGVNAEEDMDVQVAVSVVENTLILNVYNKKVKVQSNDVGSGLGISNTRERLMLLYPEKHTLVITDTEEDFNVLLTLQLK